jgi:hypothetical protein
MPRPPMTIGSVFTVFSEELQRRATAPKATGAPCLGDIRKRPALVNTLVTEKSTRPETGAERGYRFHCSRPLPFSTKVPAKRWSAAPSALKCEARQPRRTAATFVGRSSCIWWEVSVRGFCANVAFCDGFWRCPRANGGRWLRSGRGSWERRFGVVPSRLGPSPPVSGTLSEGCDSRLGCRSGGVFGLGLRQAAGHVSNGWRC